MSRISRRSLVGGALLLPVAAVTWRGALASQGTVKRSSASSSQTGETFEVDAIDIDYSVKEIKASANTDVIIKLVNKGVLEHDLHIDKLDLTTKLLKPGEEDEIVVNAPAGEYDYWCTVAGHKESGMAGKLILEEKSPSASPAASPMATPQAGGDVFEVDAIDIDYSVKEIKAKAETDVTIKLVNKGVLEHDLHIDKLDLTTKLLKPGEEDEIVVNAPAGEYDYWCTVAGHKESGMAGKLILE
ncbi:MAG TPA: cupredoxin domain-containing protein [Thermomicrobiales bacterium]|nr:cupredoxin domain-containing protein [Thermomicrobiales bacterium]